MYENNAGDAVIKRNQNQGNRRNGNHITHRIGIIKQIENDDATYQHNSYREGIGNIHGSIKKSWLYFVPHAAFRTMLFHLGEIEEIPPLKFKQTTLMALGTTCVNGGFQFGRIRHNDAYFEAQR
jgi:hypothetical protein